MKHPTVRQTEIAAICIGAAVLFLTYFAIAVFVIFKFSGSSFSLFFTILVFGSAVIQLANAVASALSDIHD